MRERAITFLLALAALGSFYALWFRPASFESDRALARPTTAERRGNGYAGLFEWLRKSGYEARSFRDRYSALPELDAAPRGNLLILALPAVEVFRNEEFSALDQWIRRGNTLLVTAALLDQPGWAAGRAPGTVVEIESLTSIEFETRTAREERLDPTPLAQRVREADAGDADEEEGDDMQPEPDEALQRSLDVPEKIALTPTGPHALLAGVRKLTLETDYTTEEWSLRMPYDNFVLTLARTAGGEGALFEQRLGQGRILLAAGGSLFTNRALGNDDNARLISNIVAASVATHGVVLFDDLRQGLSANYDPARLYRDPRLYRTVLILLGLWLVWVLGSTRLRAPAIVRHDPSEAELVRSAGGLIARTIAPHQTALRMFDHFFTRVARAVRGASREPERGELWQWLEHHAAIRPQELDQLKVWYAAAHSGRKLELVPLQNLLDNLGKRLKT
jgi:hypothetical protein